MPDDSPAAPPAGALVAPFVAVSLAGCGDCGAPPTSVAGERPDVGGWIVDVTTATGLVATHVTGATGERWMPEVMGGGVGLFDADGDDRLDAYIVQGHRDLPDDAPVSDPVNELWRGQADGTFVRAADSGLEDGGYGMGVAVGDIDNDGDLDVFVTNYGADRLYRNRGDGRFDDVTLAAEIDVPGWSASAAFLDFDGDGWLDLFVTQYVTVRQDKRCPDRAGRDEYCGPLANEPRRDVLLRNRGDGTFEDVSVRSGIASIVAAGLGVVCLDLTGDDLVDIYVANDGYANVLWVNEGNGTFRDTALHLGLALNLHGKPEAGMGVVADDLDDDGRVDLFVTNLTSETNTFYRSLEGGRFVDATAATGLCTDSMASTGFGVVAVDLELDGDLDLVVVNGRIKRDTPVPNCGMASPWHEYAEPNHVYLNTGGGAFRQARRGADADLTGPAEVSRGLAAGDVDGDGDIDFLTGNLDGPARLHRNDAPRAGRWLLVRAVEPERRRDALGARVTVVTGERRRTRAILAAHSYLAASEPVAHFGLGPVARVDDVIVTWPDGIAESFGPQGLDQVLVLRRGSAPGAPR